MNHDPKILAVIERLMDAGISGVSAFAEIYAKPHIPALALKFLDDLWLAGYNIEANRSPSIMPKGKK
jgi:hypothetical protein